MERKVNIQDWQKVTVEDFNNFGLFPRSSFDHVVGDLCVPGMKYTGFTTVQTAPAVVTVGNGRLYHNGLVFYNDSEGGVSLDLLAVLPVVSYSGPLLADLLTGSFVIETIFQIPGIGVFIVNGSLNRDYTMVVGLVIMYAALLIVLNLLVDFLYTLLDPRVKYE